MTRAKTQLLWRSNDSLYTVVISRHALKKMSRLAKEHSPNEVGTSLVGSYSEDGYTAFVLDIAPLPSDSKSSPVSFVRGIAGMKEFFTSLTKRFRKTRFYIGEWHSHPFAEPDSSSQDKSTHEKIARDKSTGCSEVVMIVLGGDFNRNRHLSVSVHSAKMGLVELNSAHF